MREPFLYDYWLVFIMNFFGKYYTKPRNCLNYFSQLSLIFLLSLILFLVIIRFFVFDIVLNYLNLLCFVYCFVSFLLLLFTQIIWTSVLWALLIKKKCSMFL